MDKTTIDPWGSKEIKIDEKLIKEFGLKKFKESEREDLDSLLQPLIDKLIPLSLRLILYGSAGKGENRAGSEN